MKFSALLFSATLPLFTQCKRTEPVAAAPSPVTNVSSTAFSGFTKQPGKLVVIDFYADWCAPCKELSPMLEKLAAEYPSIVEVGRVDIERAGQLANRLNVRPIPDVRFYRDGKLVDQFIGLISETQLRKKFEVHSRGLTPSSPAPQ
jgi:thioredoxin 1